MPRQHWMTDIVDEVRGRMKDMMPDIAAGLHDSAPYGHPPPEPPKPSIDEFMQMDPQTRQAYIQGSPDSYALITDLQKQAGDRYGALAATLAPMFQMEAADNLSQHLQFGQQTGIDNQIGVLQAKDDMARILGVDPFGGT